MKTTIHFRRAVKQDFDFLLTLRKLSMNDHLAQAGLVLNDEQHKQRVAEYFDDSFIVYHNEQAIGLLKFAVLAEHIHIRQFQLMPNFHGRGIGSQVLNLLKAKATERKLAITLNVLLNNPALRLYQRHGFVVEGQNSLEYQMRWNHQP